MERKQATPRKYHDTYEAIIKTAQQLFMEVGYRGVSTRKIADHCGITQPALYHHFKNKQTLYVAVIRFTLIQTESKLNNILKDEHTFRDRLKQIALYMMENFNVDLSQMFHDIFHELNPDQQQEIHQWWLKGFLQPVVKMLNDAISNQQIRDLEMLYTNVTELAYIFLNLIKSTLQPQKMKQFTIEQRKEIERKANLIVEVFLHGLGK